MAPKAAVSVSTNGTASQLGALSAAQKMVISFHVFLIVGTGVWTLTIESDATNAFVGAETTRATLTSVDQDDDPAMAVATIAGAVTDTWWRAVLTETSGTATITYSVSLGIANA